jgi:hypothetical protein
MTALAPLAASIEPQAGAPPSDDLTIAGPSTNSGAASKTLVHENTTTMTQSHLLDQNSAQPWRSWKSKVSVEGRDAQSIEMQSNEATLTA